MSVPDEVTQLRDKILEKFANCLISIEGPSVGGIWWLDADYNGRSVSTEFWPGRGWGVSLIGHPTKDIDVGFGSGYDEVFQDHLQAAERILVLLEE